MVMKIWAPSVFKVMFNSFYSPFRVFTDMSSEIKQMVATAGTYSDIERACAIIHIPDFIIVLLEEFVTGGHCFTDCCVHIAHEFARLCSVLHAGCLRIRWHGVD